MKSLKLLCAVLLAAVSMQLSADPAKTYKVTSIKGESLVLMNGKWKTLEINDLLNASTVLKNPGQTTAEVTVRELGSPDCFNIFLINDEFRFARFSEATEKDGRRNSTSSFSYFIRMQLSISREPNARITRTSSAATHRGGAQASALNPIIASIASKCNGNFFLKELISCPSDYPVELLCADGALQLCNFSDKRLHAVVFVLSQDEYGDYSINFLHGLDANFILDPESSKILESENFAQGKQLVAIVSETGIDPLPLRDDLLNADSSDLSKALESCQYAPTGISVLR